VITFITRFVDYLFTAFNWQVLAFLAIVFFVCGIMAHVRSVRQARSRTMGQKNTPVWPPIVAVAVSILVFAISLSLTHKLEARRLIKTTTETIVRPCDDCLDKTGKFRNTEHFGDGQQVAANSWYVPADKLEPILINRIEVLPVHPPFNSNPRYGFDTKKILAVVFIDIAITNELNRNFDEWEQLLVSILFGFLMYWACITFEKRKFRTAVASPSYRRKI
jgi:hypothetical protein